MLPSSVDYESAIIGGRRRIVPRAIIDLIDPDIVYGTVESNGETIYSRPERIHNKVLELKAPKYATLERNRFVLDGSWSLLPDDPEEMKGEQGYIIGILSSGSGTFLDSPFVQLNIENVSILQAASVYFPGTEQDGYGTDFLFEIYSGVVAVYSQAVSGNTKAAVHFDGFTVYDVTAIRVTFTKWSMPDRFPRVVEIVPGTYEQWGGETISAIDVVQETAFSCMTVPYGVCDLSVHNNGKRFNPYNKSGLFSSIEERQGIDIFMGVELPNQETEFLPLGVFYQQNGGWETDAYGLTIHFRLVDIIGLITQRDFLVPETLPTTLAGWIAAIVAHLGANFANRYIVDEAVANLELTATAESLENLTCGDVLRYVCMASGAFFRADALTGYLRIEPLPDSGGIEIDLRNMYSYPENEANDDVAQIEFRLFDHNSTEYIVPGNNATADRTIGIRNPFIATTAQADAVAEHILRFYGGTKFTIKGRGDMRCELGDVDTFATGFGDVAAGRRYKQQFKITNGVMTTAPSYLLSEEEAI